MDVRIDGLGRLGLAREGVGALTRGGASIATTMTAG